jgi:CheY-like chemotaxis protein
MPRLLLVDDNPSIHRIAESLLAPTDVELVCVASAAEALDRIERGERFDVALIDTAMPGMDGWTLLSRLREMEETVRMPIALMAGVLDPVDPSKLAKAPIQGFLKKPIELRELGDRVKALLATPVVVSPSPFSTMPAIPVKDLLKRGEEALPELRPEPAVEPAGPVDLDLKQPEPEDDLIVLTAEDVWPEEPIPVVTTESAPPTPVLHDVHLELEELDVAEPALPAPALHDVHLELEELDLESLQDLAGQPLSVTGPASDLQPETPSEFEPEEILTVEEDNILTLSGLEELETIPADFIDASYSPTPEPVAELDDSFYSPAPEPVAEPDDSLAHLPEAATLLGMDGADESPELVTFAFVDEAVEVDELAPAIQEPAPVTPESAPVMQELSPVAAEPVFDLEMEEFALVSAAGGQVPAVPGHDAMVPAEQSPVTTEQARAVVQAMLADPVLVDALVKAVVARMGDQVLREIAWEVMPDLAGRLQG